MPEEKVHVLIADDEDPLRTTIAAWLSDEGFAVDEAVDGIDAIKKIQTNDYDIIMLDIKMPGANGLEVLYYTKKNSAQSEVVMMTGMSDVAMAVEAMKLGAKEYLTKPIDIEHLVPQLNTLISKRDSEDRIRRLQAEYTSRLLYDLHNPIAGLRQSIGYLLKGMAGPLVEQQKEMLGYMTTSIDKVITLLDDMMDLTKLENGRVRLNRGIASINDTVQTVCQAFHIPVQSALISMEVHAQESAPPLEYDQEKIGQVLQSFLSNAIAHTPPQGTIVVQIREAAFVLAEGCPAVPHVLVSVFNTGEGISKEDLPLVFDRYRDVTASGKHNGALSGLGLIISQRIIEAHNGKIWVDSDPGKSTTFYFALPIR